MAGSLNRCTFIGNLGRDPEIRTTNSGTKIANFSIACSETWRDRNSGEKKERTEWINVVVFGPNSGDSDGLVGVIEQYVKKGSKIYVEGQWKTREWEKDGVKRYSTECVVQSFNGTILLLGESGGGGRRAPPVEEDSYDGGASYASRRDPAPRQPGGDLDDEIPF